MDSSDWQRHQAEQIWRAGVNAVDPRKLVQDSISFTETDLIISGHQFPLSKLGRIFVVGAGKAGATMAAGFEAAMPEQILNEKVSGWVNIPADCNRPLKKIHLHPARPPGVNEPTREAVQGTREILRLVSSLAPNDLCVVLISGGGSALLPAPVPEITLEDKIEITRKLSQAGATIEELNTVRSSLSLVKAGGLLRACQSQRMITLIISDVIGDPLDIIASGPTILSGNRIDQARNILMQYLRGQIPSRVRDYLEKQKQKPTESACGEDIHNLADVEHIILGNNATAVQAASVRASELGYQVFSLGSDNTGAARETGIGLVEKMKEFIRQDETGNSICLIGGGESTVSIDPRIKPGKGGRNQEVALAALNEMAGGTAAEILLLAAGTDGEDGPTDAAGAFADEETLKRARQLKLDPQDYLQRHDSYHFFQQCDSLLITGPTGTNVMDLAVVLKKQGAVRNLSESNVITNR